MKATHLVERFDFWPSREQRVLLRDLRECGTAVLGGRGELCKSCGWSQQQYNGCRNRYCPTCALFQVRKWLAARREEILPVPYYHPVFRLPSSLSAWALGRNAKMLYTIALSCAGETLTRAMSGESGGTCGVMTVLHTWSQELAHHVHVHGVVAGGVLSKVQERWESRGLDALNPDKLLEDYRGRFLRKLSKAHAEGRLAIDGPREADADADHFARFLEALEAAPGWGVYVKEPEGSVEQLLAYLVRGPITDSRILQVSEGRVRFSCRGRREATTKREVTMDVLEFTRRLLTHVLPKRFVRIRYYGFWSASGRKKKLPYIRELLGAGPGEVAQAGAPEPGSGSEPAELVERRVCPRCGSSELEQTEVPPLSIVSSADTCASKPAGGWEDTS